MSTAVQPNVILTGGPAGGLPDSERIRFLPPTEDDVLKLPRGNRYDHFRRTAETVEHPAGELRVYTFATSTFVAE